MKYLLQCPGCHAHAIVDDAHDATAITRELDGFLPAHSACAGGVRLQRLAESNAPSPAA